VIASVKGIVQTTGTGTAVVEVNGVGYLIQTTHKIANAISAGSEVLLHTCLIVREDAFALFGFLDQQDLVVFDLLRSVNGVGPKSALAILNELSVEQISQAVISESDSTFKAVSGIGAKTAKLITLTLADKFQGSGEGLSVGSESAVEALIGLGYSERESRASVKKVSGHSTSESELLKLALKDLAKAKSR